MFFSLEALNFLAFAPQSTHVTRYMLRSRVAHRTGLCSKNSHVLSEPTTGAHQHADLTRLLLLAGFLQLINELPGFSEV